MADIKLKFPTSNADSIALTGTMASLATSSTLVAGRAFAAVDNTTNLDVDHIVHGAFRTGGSAGTANTTIEIWAIVPTSIASGTPTWPDTFGGTNAAVTITSRGMLYGYGRLIGQVWIDATTASRTYSFGGFSVAAAFGGVMVPRWQPFVVHNFGQALSSTEGDHQLNYRRVQFQTV